MIDTRKKKSQKQMQNTWNKTINDVEEHILSQSGVITARKTNTKNHKQKLNKSDVYGSNSSVRELTKMAVCTKTYRPKLFLNIPVVTLIKTNKQVQEVNLDLPDFIVYLVCYCPCHKLQLPFYIGFDQVLILTLTHITPYCFVSEV